MSVFYEDEYVTLHHGDCIEVMRALPDNSIAAVITDPPYDLTAGKKGGTGAASVNLDSPYGRSRISTGNGGFMGKDWDATGIAFDPETWRHAYRLLRPGGFLLAFGGSRTWHRLATAIEDAGFEIRDSIAWLYGSGFPKSMDVARAIDKQLEVDRMPGSDAAKAYDGWGTALKPAFEPIVVARKPLIGTVAANVLAYGTGALNIDATRTAFASEADRAESVNKNQHAKFGTEPGQNNVYGDYSTTEVKDYDGSKGRWPTNVLLEASQMPEIDRQSGPSVSSGGRTASGLTGGVYGAYEGRSDAAGSGGYGDAGGASRFFPTFRYEPKAGSAERPNVNGVQHPTVKPLELMRWLCRLVTPKDGTILDPFAGSGTTLEAALLEGFTVIGIERQADYLPLIEQRITKPLQPAMFGDWS